MTFQNLPFALVLLLFFLIAPKTYTQNEAFSMSIIGGNDLLSKPWDLHYGPDDKLWITERRNGIVLRVNPETGEREDLFQLPDIHSSGGQDGLLGMALQENLIDDELYIYLSYTYLTQSERRQRLVRYTYVDNGLGGSLDYPLTILENMPSSNDHNSGRLILGPDEKLYYTIGDQGSNHGGRFCDTVLSQVLPSQSDIDQEDWTNYAGKILRLNLDGSIPEDNPTLDGVRSHVYTYGHRNPQGLVFSSQGILYSDEHGPRTDDEVNIIYSGSNYGWPNVAGYKDDKAYSYCNWSSASDCASLVFDAADCPPNAELLSESDFTASNFQEPLLSMFAVSDDFDFDDPRCDNAWLCRPNVAPSSLGVYESEAIPNWTNSLLVTSLKRGRVYRLQMDETGTEMIGDTTEHFYTPNRYRDITVSPDGKSFYIITDDGGSTSGPSGITRADSLENPGAILKFTLKDPLNTRDLDLESSVKVYPNPVSESLFLELKDPSLLNAKAEIFSLSGQIIRKTIELKSHLNDINLAGLENGIYIIKLSTEKGSWFKKIVVYSRK